MRHGKRFNHLGRTATHRKAMLSNMASSLLVNKRINTTLAKAKELRKYVEPLITKAKNDSTHSRRVVFSYLKDKESVNALFNEVVDRVASRPGGYTRIIKLGSRLGDNAEMAMIELVDFNDLLIQESEPKKAKTRRSRRGGAKPKEEKVAAIADTKTEEQEEEVAEAKSEEVVESAPVEDAAESKVEEVQEEVKEEAVEAKAEEVKAEEVKAEVTEEKEEKTPAKKTKQTEDKNEEAVEEVKAKSKAKTESAKKADSKKEDKEESEDSGKEESEK